MLGEAEDSAGADRHFQFLQDREMTDVALFGRGRLFDLQWVDGPVLDDEKVDRLLVFVSIEVERSPATVVPVTLKYLRDDPGLKNSA